MPTDPTGSPGPRRRGRTPAVLGIILFGVVVIAVIIALVAQGGDEPATTGQGAAPPSPTPSPSPTAPLSSAAATTGATATPTDTTTASVPHADGIRLEVYGDSLTVADSPDLEDGDTGPQSWVHHADEYGIDVVGAAGRWGATAPEVLQQHLREDVDAEWLLLFLGANDGARAGSSVGAAFAEHHADYVEALAQIVERQEYPAQRVVVVAIGPFDAQGADRVRAWNDLTAEAATERGWHLVDPWDRLRGPDNRYADPSLTIDGLHLSAEGAPLLAEGMAAELSDVLGDVDAAG